MLRSNLVIEPSLVQQPIANVVHMVSREASHLYQVKTHHCSNMNVKRTLITLTM